jgi:hypothetical protein
MNTKIGLFLCALAAIGPGRMEAQAPSAPPLLTGRVLVLENEGTLEGDIEFDREGGHYRIRRPPGGELWIPREHVLRLCGTLEDAYSYLRSRANLNDPDEHLRLAHWCQGHGLRKQAAAEVSEALDQRPDRETRRWLDSLKRGPAVGAVASKPPANEDVEMLQNAPAVSTQSLSLFVKHVQPLLMNACASCHATGRGGRFKILHTYGNMVTNRRTVQQNLVAALGQLNKERPETSPLLQKAVSIHGDMGQPALKNRETQAYKNLDEWVRITVGGERQLPEPATVALGAGADSSRPLDREAVTVSQMRQTGAGSETSHVQSSKIAPPAGQSTAANAEGTKPTQIVKPIASAAHTEPVDVYDPLLFNRQLHPQPTQTPKSP